MARKQHHVVANLTGGWDVKKNGYERSSIHTDTKQEAVDQGRIISQNQNSELIIHGKNGKIQVSNSHGKD